MNVLECVGILIFNNVSEEIPQHKMPLRKINDKRSIELSTLWLRVLYVYVPLILSLKTWLPMWMCAWFWIYFRCRDLLSLAAACRCRRHATCLSDHIGQSHHPYRAVIIHVIWWCTLLLRRSSSCNCLSNFNNNKLKYLRSSFRSHSNCVFQWSTGKKETKCSKTTT